MTTTNLKMIEALQAFLDGNQLAAFAVLGSKAERYHFVRKTLVTFSYMNFSKRDKGVVIRYLIKMKGYSRQQLTRLIRKYTKTGKIDWTPCRSNGFERKYTRQDIVLLAKTDQLHDAPCGQAVKKICERAFDVFDDDHYKRLSELSISHLYNLRDSDRYKKQRQTFTKTQSRQVAIGERRKPHPEGKPAIFALIRFIRATWIR